MAKIPLDNFQLQFISHQNEKMSYLDGIHEAITGLCGWVQLRMKDASDDEVRPIAYKVKEWCKIMNVTFIIDDRVELVKEVGADGVHLGKNDMPIAEARKILGDDFIIGGLVMPPMATIGISIFSAFIFWMISLYPSRPRIGESFSLVVVKRNGPQPM